MQEVQYLDWDSSFFGYRIGQILSDHDLKKNLDNAKKEAFRLVYVRSESLIDSQLCFEKNGQLVDEKLTFLRTVPEHPSESKAIIYQHKEVSDSMKLLALQSGEYSRFKIDTNFKNQEFEKLYTAWIENSVAKQIASHVIVYKEGNNIIGLLTLGIKNGRGDIGVLAVDKTYRRLGIGKELIKKALNESKKMQVSDIQVVTQGANTNACNFYKSHNFVLEKKEYIYHFWL